jgi:hypothetical protein
MRIFFIFILCFTCLIRPGPSQGQALPVSVSDSGVSLSDPQWKTVIEQFEKSIFDLSNWLEKNQVEKKKLKQDIDKLESKITELRQDNQKNSNVFDEIRLKGLLNDLKDKLEKNSDLQHLEDGKQKEFEQKALSLTALYNDRIESELKSTGNSSEPSALQLKLNELALLIRKRNQIQTLLTQHQKKADKAESLSIASFDSLGSNDRESLQLSLDLIKDRKKDLEENIEKWSIEEEEVKNELKLQGKMQDFLEDIKRMNEDSDFPSGNLKKNDFGGMTGSKQHDKLEAHLSEIHGSLEKAQAALAQINQLMAKVQHQLDAFEERKSK